MGFRKVSGFTQRFVGFRNRLWVYVMVRGFSQRFMGLPNGFVFFRKGLCAFAKVSGPRNSSNHIRTCTQQRTEIVGSPSDIINVINVINVLLQIKSLNKYLNHK